MPSEADSQKLLFLSECWKQPFQPNPFSDPTFSAVVRGNELRKNIQVKNHRPPTHDINITMLTAPVEDNGEELHLSQFSKVITIPLHHEPSLPGVDDGGSCDKSFGGSEAPFSPLWRELIIIFLCTCGQITLTLPATALLGGLKLVARDFGMSQSESAWVSSALLTSSGSFLLLGGRLSDIYGRKILLVSSYGMAAIWSVVAAVARNKYLFFIARGMQGLCGAGAVPAALGILGANYSPGKRKNLVFASFSAGNPVGAATGLILGGVLTSYVSWRWVLFIIAIFETVITIGSFFLIPNDQSIVEQKNIDWLGAVIVTAGLSVFCFGVTEAENAPDGWATWWIILCLISGIALIGLFIFVESRASTPLMPFAIWKIPQFGKLLVCFGVGLGVFWGGILYGYSLYYQQIYLASPAQVTLYLIPMAIVGLLTNVVGGFILHLVPGNILMSIGLACYAVSGLLGALQPLNMTYWAMSFPAMIIGVIGADVTGLVTNVYATTHAAKADQSVASAVVGTAASLFGAICTSIVAALISGIGGNDIQQQNPDRGQLIKGFQAEFWFVFASAVVFGLLALTLKLGRQDTTGDESSIEIETTKEYPTQGGYRPRRE